MEPKVNHDQSPGGSATTQALRAGTPTAWPALIVDAPARLPSASKHAIKQAHYLCHLRHLRTCSTDATHFLCGMQLRVLSTVPEMLPHLYLVQQLTPSLTPQTYADLLHAMVPHRYAMLAAFDGVRCAGLSGYWIGHKLYSGRYLEIDNFIVDAPYRSTGVGRLLVDELVCIAEREGCRNVMLDAYLDNTTAHGFYERHGFVKRGYHFMRAV